MVDGVHAVVLQHRHRIAAVRLQAVGVRRPTDDSDVAFAEFLCYLAGPDVAVDPDVVEDDHVGPVQFRPPLRHRRDEPVAYLLVALGLDVVLHIVALAVDLPREVAISPRRANRTETVSTPYVPVGRHRLECERRRRPQMDSV